MVMARMDLVWCGVGGKLEKELSDIICHPCAHFKMLYPLASSINCPLFICSLPNRGQDSFEYSRPLTTIYRAN